MSIVLVPVGEIDPEIPSRLRERLATIFSEGVAMAKKIPLSADALNGARSQYDAEMVLESLSLAEEPRRYDRALGIVNADLYVPGMNFVFGLAGRRNAIISLHRLRQSFYHLPEDPDLFINRVLVEAVHELGHTYGLGHCNDPKCVMHFSNTISDTDRKGPGFCTSCQQQVMDGRAAGR
jgi:archaemetzincin